MTELDKLKRAQMYVEQLANGKEPITGIDMPQDTVLNNERLAKCFSYVSYVLQKVIENGGEVAKKPENEKLPFEITEQEKSRIIISEIPISITVVCDNISNAVDLTVFKKLSAVKVNDWFTEKGLLKEIESAGGKSKRKTLTDKSALIGISQEERVSQYGKAYTANLYNREAQKFIIDHLDEILAKSKLLRGE
ncbi:MAG: hypothetical protein FWD71_14010 [Oscillospiraceae bacterium]|nr:hypothetical protein [Oscillospiraceae bacterium]